MITGLLVAVALVLSTACTEDAPPTRPPAMTAGEVARGKGLVASYGCGTCHVVPGVRGADGLVGPPLVHWSRRSYIAGRLPNSEENLIRWIRDPQAVEPGTAMPDLGVSAIDALDIAAYLMSLE